MGFGPNLDDFSPRLQDFRPNFLAWGGGGWKWGFLHKFKGFSPFFFLFSIGFELGGGGGSEDPPVFGERLKNKMN